MKVTGKEILIEKADNNKLCRLSYYKERAADIFRRHNHRQCVWKDHAWRNDRVTARFDIFTYDEAFPNARANVSDFISLNGACLSAENITTGFMKAIYVPHDNKGTVVDEYFYEIITDSTITSFDKKSMYSLWVDIYVPEDTKADSYTGTVAIKSEEGAVLVSCTCEIEVLEAVLPSEFSTHLELWMFPYADNRYYSGKTTEEYFGKTRENLFNIKLDSQYDDALHSQLEMYAKAGGDAITVSIVEDPWNQLCTWDPYPSMVKWTKKTDGSFSFDFTDLDKWVKMNMQHGINKQIKSFTIATWDNRITYFDMASNMVISKYPKTGSEEWSYIWTKFLYAYSQHMDNCGWFDITYISLDEKPLDEIVPILDLIEGVGKLYGKTLKISLAVNKNDAEQIYDKISDLSMTDFMPAIYPQVIPDRNKKGLLTTTYTCGGDYGALLRHPGDSAYAIYHSYWSGADGYLRWALDSFNESPLISSEHKKPLAPGDINLIYPSEKTAFLRKAQSSPRYEKYIEGIREIEKIKYLKRHYPMSKGKIDDLMQKAASKETTGDEAADIRNEIYKLYKLLAKN